MSLDKTKKWINRQNQVRRGWNLDIDERSHTKKNYRVRYCKHFANRQENEWMDKENSRSVIHREDNKNKVGVYRTQNRRQIEHKSYQIYMT